MNGATDFGKDYTQALKDAKRLASALDRNVLLFEYDGIWYVLNGKPPIDLKTLKQFTITPKMSESK